MSSVISSSLGSFEDISQGYNINPGSPEADAQHAAVMSESSILREPYKQSSRFFLTDTVVRFLVRGPFFPKVVFRHSGREVDVTLGWQCYVPGAQQCA